MGVTNEFICDHKQLADKTAHRWPRQRFGPLPHRRPGQVQPDSREQQGKLWSRHQSGVTARSKSPDLAYRTLAVPVDMLYDTFQPTVGEDGCRNTDRSGRVPVQSPGAQFA
ncbi:hypothetical protein DPEC_G00378980 [Dallia pectoralis]|nr:hypothetical protein DPEC_G00378980 [Dallia pectoralis]